MLGAVGVWFGTRGVPLTREEQGGGRLSEQLRIIMQNRDARWLILSFVLPSPVKRLLPKGKW